MDAYSQDLRERVARACDSLEMSQPEVAEAFGVSLSFITKRLRRRRQTGLLGTLAHAKGPEPMIQSSHQRKLQELLEEQPDATLAELCDRLGNQTGVHVSVPTMCRALDKLGWHRKKELSRLRARYATGSKAPQGFYPSGQSRAGE
jgi:transposase